MNNPLTSLQDAIAEKLKTEEMLSAVEIITEDRGDLASSIETALAQLGICLIVGVARLGVSNPNAPGPQFDSVSFSVAVTENVTLNRAPGSLQLDALSAAIRISQCLHHWRPIDAAEFSGMTIMAATDAILYQQEGDLLAYDVNFNLGRT